MRTAITAFAVGIVWLQWQPALPDLTALAAFAALGTALLALPFVSRLRAAAPVGAFLVGIAWAGFMAQARLADALPPENESRDIEVVGVVAGLPQQFENGLRFEFDVEEAAQVVPRRVSLAWYRGWRESDEEMPPLRQLHAGERWRFTVRLKRPHGNFNPHGYDYEAALLERGIRATGYVRPGNLNARQDEFVPRPGYAVERLRERIRERYGRVLGDSPYAGILVALAVGDQRAIDPGLWQVFARTGTTHLMSISGLHVTMFAGLALGLVSWLWRRSPRLPLLLPAQKAAAVAGFLAAFAYSLLAGFEVPAQRTLYMLGVVALALWSGRSLASSRVLALALLAVLLLDPWAVLAAGFWLSFGAVALLFYIGTGRIGKGHWLADWGRAQWAVTVGMVPALLALFQQFSLVSPLANAVAIPVVSFVVTPLALAGSLPLGEPLLWLSHLVMRWQMALLQWLAASDWAIWQQHVPPPWSVALAVAGIVWLLLPRGFPARWLGLVACLPLLLVAPPRPPPGAAVVTVLDVGQGLALLVQTAAHDLLYDTGPMFSADANSGNRIIVPYLRALGVTHLDGLVVTHADIDHAGGAESVLEAVPVGWISSSLPFEHPLSAQPVAQRPCQDGDAWEWDGVRFEMLHPPAVQFASPTRKTNDMSCVLKVSAAGKSMLLTSDIEALSETALLARHGRDLHADVLTVPHHGSRTSSTAAFIAAVGAGTAIFPVGYRNRFGHPKADVVERYRATGAALHRTDSEGALTVRLGAGGVEIASARAERRRYWHGR
ncbi:MAG: DNA internalization-related competence protein ComEC/Rec2 [Rhodocyclales bacterium GWA2_65_20]|nr:MAG: DNA internalization-related competence protein ComEC/Rec2 [Rhodocyclales bacterium GWA2_65_20]